MKNITFFSPKGLTFITAGRRWICGAGCIPVGMHPMHARIFLPRENPYGIKHIMCDHASTWRKKTNNLQLITYNLKIRVKATNS